MRYCRYTNLNSNIMKHLTLVFGILLSVTAFSQCEYRYFNTTGWDTVITEEWDINNSILYRKYYSTQKDTVEEYYVDGCDFKQEGNSITFEDERATFFQSYLRYEECKYMLGYYKDVAVYSRTYILPEENYDYEKEDVVDSVIKKVTIFSRFADFSRLYAVTFLKEDGVIHHNIF